MSRFVPISPPPAVTVTIGRPYASTFMWQHRASFQFFLRLSFFLIPLIDISYLQIHQSGELILSESNINVAILSRKSKMSRNLSRKTEICRENLGVMAKR